MSPREFKQGLGNPLFLFNISGVITRVYVSYSRHLLFNSKHLGKKGRYLKLNLNNFPFYI